MTAPTEPDAGLPGILHAPVSLTEQITCVAREIRLREAVYPKWSAAGKISRDRAEFEIRAMKAVLETLQKLHQVKVAAAKVGAAAETGEEALRG
jgi:hypothetical protein